MSSLPSYQTDIISKTRKILGGARNVALSTVQEMSLVDPGVKGPSWVSRISFAAPEDEARGPLELLKRAIDVLGNGKGKYTCPTIEDVEARWTGYRPGLGDDEAGPSISEHEAYQGLMKGVRSPLIIMFFHGGGFTFVLPLPHRHLGIS